MFGIDSTVLAFIVLAGFSAGAVAYAFLFNTIAEEKNVGKRLETVKKAETDRSVVKASRDRVAEAAKRRKSVQDSLNELDAKQKSKDRNIKNWIDWMVGVGMLTPKTKTGIVDVDVPETLPEVRTDPALLIKLINEPSAADRDLTSMRVIQSGGQRLQPETRRGAQEVFGNATVQENFGMAEGLLMFVRLDDPDDFVRLEIEAATPAELRRFVQRALACADATFASTVRLNSGPIRRSPTAPILRPTAMESGLPVRFPNDRHCARSTRLLRPGSSAPPALLLPARATARGAAGAIRAAG